MQSLDSLRNIIRSSEVRVGRANDIWFWLAGFRVFIDSLEDQGMKVLKTDLSDVVLDQDYSLNFQESSLIEKINNKILNKNAVLNTFSKEVRTYYRKHQTQNLKAKFLKDNPPVKLNRELFL